ncbi:putative galactokinase galactose-binding signature [Lyophyllum shimeji]|uniref:Galactokinase n=1 Tax=Lyophyllum shimeji TaxID=47721 RepID=A0A9P3UQY1_LYOSH|nr:putative galactokinase galactose-binding signature [Lyophyllum shimeji]
MAAERPIPVYTNLADLYSNLGASLNHAVRWNNLAEEFQKRFGRKPAYIARAPGRVNLIGEHIDYALFGVLPAAIERDILIACGPRPVPASSPISEAHHSPGSVIAENLHTKYARQVFAPARKASVSDEVGEDKVHVEGWHLDINTKELRWESYVKAGYYGVLDHYFKSDVSNANATSPIPVDLLVTGSVPAGSGLSSSAAMVVASTLAFLAVNGKLDDQSNSLTKGELVKMSMENEKRVGVNSGGMDQAASVISDASSALFISFFPTLKATPVPLPAGSVFVCANSLVVADKAVGAKRGYNLRVVETLVGARVLARALGVPVGEKERITLREVVGRLLGEEKEHELDVSDLQKGLERMAKEVEVLRPKGVPDDGELGVTMEEMIEMSGLPEDKFRDVYLSWVEVEATHFQLYKRAKHVYAEALRVLQFRQTCLDVSAGSPAGNDSGSNAALERLGQLMNESQTSCAELFECSCPELNNLTQLARKAGAIGSRLTGAGWGGCTVSLVAEDKIQSFIEQIRDTYAPYKGLEGEALSEVIFATRPSSGACVYKFE